MNALNYQMLELGSPNPIHFLGFYRKQMSESMLYDNLAVDNGECKEWMKTIEWKRLEMS